MFLSLFADRNLDEIRTAEDTRRAITARIERRVSDDTEVPDFIQHQIDDVVEQIGHLVLAELPGDENRFLRLHVYYAEFIRSIDSSLREEATRQFDEYVGVLIRNAQETQYRLWTDGAEVHVA